MSLDEGLEGALGVGDPSGLERLDAPDELFLESAGNLVIGRAGGGGKNEYGCEAEGGLRPLFELVAEKASQWNTHGNIGLVVGATCPEELRLIRRRHPDMPLLIPGIGAQGGDLALTVGYGVDKRGQKAIINSSRQIIYASRGKDFAEAARRAAIGLRDRINQVLSTRPA